MDNMPADGDDDVQIVSISYRSASDSIGIMLNLDNLPSPDNWGALFAQVIHLLGNTFCQIDGTFDPTPFTDRIREVLLEELDRPAPSELGTRLETTGDSHAQEDNLRGS